MSWFDDNDVKKFIFGPSFYTERAKLAEYIEMHNSKNDSVLFGVFRKNLHIANIKFEPIDISSNLAWIGILIGKRENRSLGYGGEIIRVTTKNIHEKLGVDTFRLGVNVSNIAALKSYKKIGFEEIQKKNQSKILELKL